MGLSGFPVAPEGLLPWLVMNTALLVSQVKSTWRFALQAIPGGVSAEAEARDPAPRDEVAASGKGRVRVKRLETVCPETSAAGEECSCSCCVCLCRFEAEEEVSELSCRHFFHRECLGRWLEKDHRTCPLCRSAL